MGACNGHILALNLECGTQMILRDWLCQLYNLKSGGLIKHAEGLVVNLAAPRTYRKGGAPVHPL